MKANVFDNRKIVDSYLKWYIDNPRWDTLEKSLILELIHPQKGETLLDVGCGVGWHLRWFKDLGLEVKGIDASPLMIKKAKEFLEGKVDVEVMDATNLTFPDNYFDIVTIITLIEFVDTPERIIKEAIRVAKRRLFLGVLNKFSFLGIKRKMKSIFRPSIYRYAKFYSVRGLINLIKLLNTDLKIRWGTTIPHPPAKNWWGAFIGIGIEKS